MKLNAEFEVVDTFSYFIKPEYSEGVTDFITRLTGIRTSDVSRDVNYEEALEIFNTWIGTGKNRIYSWSNSDLRQIVMECEYKNVKFPTNITRWVDFQLLFPRLMGLNHDVQMSLYDAANWHGAEIDCKSVHRALYDAEVTTELVRGVLTGEYKEIARNIHQYYEPTNKTEEQCTKGTCLGDLFGDIFSDLMQDKQSEFSR